MKINKNILYRYEPNIDNGTGYIFFKDSEECIKVGEAIIKIIREVEKNSSIENLEKSIIEHESFNKTIQFLKEMKIIT